MIGIWGAHAQAFLLVLAIVTTIVFAAPIFFAPLRWARVFTWRIPADTDLAVYFGRCLGAFALVLEFFIFRAALTGAGLFNTFRWIVAVAAMMVIVHIWGAVQRIQPLLETLEIGMYAGLGILGLLFWPLGAAG